MTIRITSDSIVNDIQEKFHEAFPFLKIDFFRSAEVINRHKQNSQKQPGSHSIGDGIEHATNKPVEISPLMTVQALEKLCEEELGVYVQLSRKFGNSWMEISMTNSWSIFQQNERGREICSVIYKETEA